MHSRIIQINTALLLFGNLSAIGCSNSESDLSLDSDGLSEEAENSEDEPDAMSAVREGSLYMRSQMDRQAQRDRIRIDFADDQQYQFVKDRLAVSGVNSLTSPGLLDRIESARELALSGEEYRSAGDSRCSNIISTPNLSAENYSSRVDATCFDGSQYIFTDLYIYNSEGELQSFSYDDEWNGILTEVEGDILPPAGLGVWSDSLIYAVTGTGDEMYYTSTITLHDHLFDGIAMSNAQAQDGVNGLSKPNDPQAANVDHPADWGGNGDVLVCLDRLGSDPDCDYSHSQDPASPCTGDIMCVSNGAGTVDVQPAPYNPDKIYLPIGLDESSFIPFHPSAHIVSASADLILKTPGGYTGSGGDCYADMLPAFQNWGPSGGGTYATVEDNGIGRVRVNIDPFAIGMGNGTWSSSCVDHRADTHLILNITFESNGLGGMISWDSELEGSFNLLAVAWGCLLPETMITMADGSQLPVEAVEIGDHVLSEDGAALVVKDFIRGTESRPVVEIEDEYGHVVTVTDTHPIPTANRGVVQARDLEEGDWIEAREGPVKAISVSFVDYEGSVFNLELGAPEGTDESKAGRTTMYADGILVGDLGMQGTAKQVHDDLVESERKNAPIPGGLEVDYVFSKGVRMLRKVFDGQS